MSFVMLCNRLLTVWNIGKHLFATLIYISKTFHIIMVFNLRFQIIHVGVRKYLLIKIYWNTPGIFEYLIMALLSY